MATAAVAIILIISLIAFAEKTQHDLTIAQNQLISSKNANLPNPAPTESVSEAQQMIDKIGKLITLPTDEQPAVATVTDLSQLKSQPFFANALVGDKVLIYAKAKEAILYRPSTDKIIEVAPVTDSGAAASSTSKKK